MDIATRGSGYLRGVLRAWQLRDAEIRIRIRISMTSMPMNMLIKEEKEVVVVGEEEVKWSKTWCLTDKNISPLLSIAKINEARKGSELGRSVIAVDHNIFGLSRDMPIFK